MSEFSDHTLGVNRPLTRRDFLDGVALGIGALCSARPLAAQEDNYPPARTGMRGSHDGSFEALHALRDGKFWKDAGKPQKTREVYDLVVVGGGISGLSAACLYRKRAGASARILILDNHDDFGGHAKRNEFQIGGGTYLINGGTVDIDSPTPYSTEADGLLKELGIDPASLAKKYPRHRPGELGSLREGMFFDKETFGEDRLLVGMPGSRTTWADFLAGTPMPEQAKLDIRRLQEDTVDYMPGLSSAEKKDRLWRMSYKDFLLNVVKVDPSVIPFYQARTHGEFGVGIDAESALDCWGYNFAISASHRLPGFDGLNLEKGGGPHMSYTSAGYASGGSYSFHFPDGNATIARLLVRSLIPDAVPGSTVEDVITSRVDYSRLDRVGAPVRIRLSSPVVRAKHRGNPESAKTVEVTYAHAKRAFVVQARNVVLACWNMTIPYLCPDLPEKQKQALHYLVKVPLVFTRVALKNFAAHQQLGVSNISSPGMYHSEVRPEVGGPDMGTYKSARVEDGPAILNMLRTPCSPGVPARDQHRAGRAELLSTPFVTFERNIRDQLLRTLAKGGFDPARDIEAITVNRWAHGYGYEYNPLFDPEWPRGEAPHEVGRKRFGRIAIANADSQAAAYTDAAINQAFRAVNELLS